MASLSDVKSALASAEASPGDLKPLDYAGKLSAQYLLEQDPQPHWFCDEALRPLARVSLIAFSYSLAKEYYGTMLGSVLDRCAKCARNYHIDFCMLRADLQNRGIPHEAFDDYCQYVNKYDRERLGAKLESGVEKINRDPNANLVALKELIPPIYECLCFDLFKKSSTTDDSDDSIYNNFKKLLMHFTNNGSGEHSISMTELTPGLLLLHFGRDRELHQWAKAALKDIDKEEVFNLATLETYTEIVHGLQSRLVYSNLVDFWFNMDELLRHCSKAQLLQLGRHDPGLVQILSNEILLLPNASLHSTLRTLAYLLQILGSQFWSFTTANSTSLSRAILANQHFAERLNVTGRTGYDNDYIFRSTDLLDWTHVLIDSCAPSSRCNVGDVICSSLYKMSSKVQDQKQLVTSIALQVNSSCFGFKTGESLPLLAPAERVLRLDLKQMMCSCSVSIIQALIFPELNSQALEVISQAVQFDVVSALPDVALRGGSEMDSTDAVKAEIARSKEFPSTLWESLNQRPALFKKGLISTLVKASKFSVFVSHLPTKRSDVYWPKGELSQKAVACAVSSFNHIADSDPKVLKELLKDHDWLVSLLLNGFAADGDQNQTTVDIICQALETDTINRPDAMYAILSTNLRGSLLALCESLELITRFEMLGPISQAIKVMQDVTSALFGAAGVLDTTRNQFSPGEGNELVKLWDASWKLLRVCFECTYRVWSKVYKAGTMIEILRNFLDFCKQLLDAFRLVESNLSKNGEKNFGEQLIMPAVNSVDALCLLLRLKDETLIHSSYVNIMAIIDLMNSFKIEIPANFLALLKRLALREISNVIPTEMTSNMLAKTGKFTQVEIDAIFSNQKFATPVSSTASTPAPTPKPSSGLANRAPANDSAPSVAPRKGQMSLSDFMRPSKGPSFVPPPAPPASKHSAMDAVREAVKNQRNSSTEAARKKAVAEIHPARPAGFHSKRAQEIAARRATAGGKPGAAEADSRASDESDDESESDLEGLFTSKTGPQQVNPLAVHRSTSTFSHGHRPASSAAMQSLAKAAMRKRLNIDMSPLYKQILSWDYHSNSDYPDSRRDQKAVPSTFDSLREYGKVFEPLLMLECWQGIRRSKESVEVSETPFKLVCGNRVTCDSFIDIYVSMETAVLDQIKLGETDLLVLTYYESTENVARRPDPKRPYCLAKVKNITRASPDTVDVELRSYRPDSMLPYLAQKVELHAMRVMNMTTLEREFCALEALEYYELKDAILSGQPAPPATEDQSTLSELQEVFNVNESQSKAIASSISNSGFSLIQGPPGTGKTKTILGIVGAMLTSSPAVAPSIVNTMAVQKEAHRQILICAPSNAAVDELVLRMKAGIVGFHGKKFEPRVVRLGRSEAINSQVKELTLEEQVDKALEALENANMDNRSDGSLRTQMNEIVSQRAGLRKELEDQADKLEAMVYEQKDMEIRALTQKIKQIGHELDLQRERGKAATRARDSERRRLQKEILQRSHIICSTLSGSAHQVLSSLQMTFDTVVIDEAAQCIELSALIPLKYGCRNCIMVGDPNQLPPTVLSMAATKKKYNQSLFVRMFNRYPNAVHMLNTQFRMHPSISKFPSEEFYHGKLLNGPNMASLTARPWHKEQIFSPYRFFDVKGRHQKSSSKSLYNQEEAHMALEIFIALLDRHRVESGSIGIISPYKSQVNELKRVFRAQFGNDIFNEVDFNTIDGFQGQEKDIIILSCVRAEPDATGVGFLDDTRRMNVAVTRARASMWILGSEQNLVQSEVWSRLIQDAKERQMYTVAERGFVRSLANAQGTDAMVNASGPLERQRQAPTPYERPADPFALDIKAYNGNGKRKQNQSSQKDNSNQQGHTKNKKQKQKNQKPVTHQDAKNPGNNSKKSHKGATKSQHPTSGVNSLAAHLKGGFPSNNQPNPVSLAGRLGVPGNEQPRPLRPANTVKAAANSIGNFAGNPLNGRVEVPMTLPTPSSSGTLVAMPQPNKSGVVGQPSVVPRPKPAPLPAGGDRKYSGGPHGGIKKKFQPRKNSAPNVFIPRKR